MRSYELRQKFLSFFEKRGHKIIPSASLIPSQEVELSGTQKVLFTTAGMHPLIPYLLGESHTQGKKLVNVQKCLRTDDIDEIGDSVHCTFFEMLGNWSLGDYWKKEAIKYSWEFLIDVLGLKENRIYVSVFEGDKNAPFDKESFDFWKEFIPQSRIFKYGKKENWWGPIGETGPCGPDTEMFYDIVGGDLKGEEPAKNSERFIEIWNDVFMEYDKQKDGNYKPLAQKNVDTGMGLERMLAVLQGKNNIYETDLFTDIINLLEKKAKSFNIKSARIIADHIKASIFIAADGIEPSNKDQGYILRRLIRRAEARASYSLGMVSFPFIDIFDIYQKIYANSYPEIIEKKEKIVTTIEKEIVRFHDVIEQAVKEFEKIKKGSKDRISGKDVFYLHTTHGLTIDIVKDWVFGEGLSIDEKGFEEEFKKHQEISRKGLEKKFAGGLGGKSPKVIVGHTATHLLHQALRQILGDHVHQTGSNITEERLRFDFSHGEKLTDDQIKNVEKLVNQKIQENLNVHQKTMPKEAAQEAGAIGLFEQKYGDLVSVYYIGSTDKMENAFSKEICGGPHAKSTGKLKNFKIVKEESAASGIRRIYAKIDS